MASSASLYCSDFLLQPWCCQTKHVNLGLVNTETKSLFNKEQSEMNLCNVFAEDSSETFRSGQWVLARLRPSEGSLMGVSSVCAEVVSEPVLLSLVPSSIAPSGTLSLSSDAPSSLPA